MSLPSDPEPGSRSQAARELFGAALPVAEQYAELLAGDGVAHGHLGPREAERLWDRHLLNCAVVADLVPDGARLLDVGSGAGLPGLPMAIRRPDLQVTLLEPMQRRVEFLQRCVAELGLGQRVEVVRGRAGDLAARPVAPPFSWVTARAVAPLDRLVGWCQAVLAPDGVVLALKGEHAQQELAEHRDAVERAGMVVQSVRELPVGSSVTRVVIVTRAPSPGVRGAAHRRNRRGGR